MDFLGPLKKSTYIIVPLGIVIMDLVRICRHDDVISSGKTMEKTLQLIIN